MTSSRADEPRVHLICQAHIDPVWIWDWPEGATETLATFEAAADLLDEYPEFVFNHNESLLYEWTSTYRPELFERIRQHVRSGRWVVSGGWYLQPDANLPSGESIARQILLGRRFFREELGVEPRVAYNLDSFGHNGNLPQFLRLAGYEMYTHFRPHPHEKQLPDYLYRWRGVDGSEVVGFRPPDGWYCSHPGSLVEGKIEEMRTLARSTGRSTTVFWGAGNHGGGATRGDLEVIRRAAPGSPEIVHSSFERYLEEVVLPVADDLPVAEGELQKCFTGCYTSIIGNKLGNRRGEGFALAAERYAALAWWLTGAAYPAGRLARVWKDLLFCQFHDMLPGSSIREGAVASADIVGRSVTSAREVMLAAQLELMRSTEPSEPLTVRVFNPHPVARRVPVIVDVQLATHPSFVEGRYLGIYDAGGTEIVRQLLEYRRSTADWRNTFLFEASLPAMGLAEYRIRIEAPTGAPDEDGAGGLESEDPDAFLAATGRRLEDFGCRVATKDAWFSADRETISISARDYAARVSREDGGLRSLVHRATGREVLSGPSPRLVVRADSNHAWGGEQAAYGAVVGAFHPASAEELVDVSGQYGEREPGPAVRVIASGPLAVVVESVLVWGRSVARLRVMFHRNHPWLDVDLLVNWAERRRALQLELATALAGTEYETEIPHATVRRPRGGGEEPCGRWVGLEEAGVSLVLVNDGPGGVDVSESTVRQSLVRSPVYCSGTDAVEPGFLGEHMDLGEHRYRFRLLFGPTGEVAAQRQLAVDDLNLPFSSHTSVPLDASNRDGATAGSDLVRLTPTGGEGAVHLEAMKVSEDGSALVVRLAERAGAEAGVTLAVDGVEPAALAFRPYEMKTLRCDKEGGGAAMRSWVECDLLERPLSGAAGAEEL